LVVALMTVLLLGMHRSGTSVATRAVNLLGVPFGGGRLIPPTPDNPGGHWESWELQDVNNLLLARLGGSWPGPPDLEPGWESSTALDAIRAEARRVWEMVQDGETWLWKDPRTCITLPFWRSVADIRGPAILIHRQPADVVASLGRRDGFSPTVSAGLWERYNRDALAGMSGWPVMVTPYTSLLRDTHRWLHQVREFLGDHQVPVGGANEIEIAAASVHPEKTQSPTTGLDCRLLPEQESLVSLLHAAEGVHGEWVVPDLGPPSPGLGRLLEEHHRAYSAQKTLEAELARARSQMGHIINRVRVKSLAYRVYQRSPLARPDSTPARGARREFGHHVT
jgi:hypothetical protein